jgi:hypothetical protein
LDDFSSFNDDDDDDNKWHEMQQITRINQRIIKIPYHVNVVE